MYSWTNSPCFNQKKTLYKIYITAILSANSNFYFAFAIQINKKFVMCIIN